MTQNDRETMQRAIGILKGVLFTSTDGIGNAMEAVIDMLDCVLKNTEGEQNDGR